MHVLPYGVTATVAVVGLLDSIAGLVFAVVWLRSVQSLPRTTLSQAAVRHFGVYSLQCYANSAAISFLLGGLLSASGTFQDTLLRIGLAAWGLAYIIRMRLRFCSQGQQRKDLRVKRHGWYGLLALMCGIVAVLL